MEKIESFTPQEVAEMLKIAKTTVYELIKRGELNYYKIGNKMRIELKDIEEYKNKHKHIKENIKVNLFEDEFTLCGQDLMLDVITRYYAEKKLSSKIYRSYIGSYNSLITMYTNDKTIATAHLWDAKTDTYNISYVKSLVPGVPVVVIHLVKRVQGFYVQKGNPKNVRTWEDLTKIGVSLINREKGSGTRVLLDENLKLLNIDENSINGYERESTSHSACASIVARGGADVAIGNEKTAMQVSNIDFIPLKEESYDMVIKKKELNTEVVQALLEIIGSQQFREEIDGLGGYDTSNIGTIVNV